MTKRQWFLGAGLVFTLGAVVWVNQGESQDDASVIEANVKRVSSAARHTSDNPSATRQPIHVPAFHEPDLGERYTEVVRDLFPDQTRHRAIPPPPAVIVPPPPPPPSAPTLPFTYVGKMLEGDKMTAFVSVGDKSYALAQGDVIDGIYRIDAMDSKRILINYLPLNITQTLLIGETR